MLWQVTYILMVNTYLQKEFPHHRHTEYRHLFFQSSFPQAECSISDQTDEFSDTWEDFDLQVKEVLVYLS